MSVGKVLVVGVLVLGALVYLVVIAMCRAAGRADRAARNEAAKRTVPQVGDLVVDEDGVVRMFTPPVGVPQVRVSIPTPRNGVTVGGGLSEHRPDGSADAH